MILEQQTEAVIIEQGEKSESIEMSLDMESTQILMQMLSKNLYSDAIGSTVRETCSNALDSHRRANIDDPIVVSFKVNNDNTYSYSVEDFGIGLDDDDVKNIISKYGKSTARNDATLLGMMGLGFKAPLAYTSSFTFVCRKNGMERKYMMYEGEEKNAIDLLYSAPTAECNGVKVIIPVKYSDRNEFIVKIREQLAYFDTVFFDVTGINNDTTIIRSELYQFSSLIQSTTMHICLDNIYYPIDFAKLGIGSIGVAIGLRFTLSDGIFPTPNRESIRYTQEAKQTIINRIKEVSTILISKYNETIVEVDDINKVFNFYRSSIKSLDIGNKSFNLHDLKNYSSVKMSVPTMTGITHLNLEALYENRQKILSEYIVKYQIKQGKMSEVKSNFVLFRVEDISSDKYLIYDNQIGVTKREYLKNLFGCYSTIYFVKKIRNSKLGFITRREFLSNDNTYYHILALSKVPRDKWRDTIKEYQLIKESFISKLKNVDKIEIDQQWLNDRKKQRVKEGSGRRQKLTGEVFGKIAVPLERYVTEKHCKFVPDTFQIENLHKFKGLLVYDSYLNQDRLDRLYYIAFLNSNIRILSFSDREKKIIDSLEIHNLISYDKFMEGQHRTFKRLVTAYLIDKLMHEYKNVFIEKDQLSTISKSFVEKLTMLQAYKVKNYTYGDDDIYESMLRIAAEHQLYDPTIYSIYLEMKASLNYLKFLEPIMSLTSYSKYEDMIPILCDLFKYYRYRIDYQNYSKDTKDCEILDLDELLLSDILVDNSNNI